MPDSVIDESNGIMRFEGPGRYAKDLDLNGKPITDIISTMAAKGIYSDPTMVAFEGLYVPENGDLSPAYAPFVGTLPPSTERGFRTRRLRGAEGPDARGLSRELGEDGCAARQDAQGRRAHRRRHRRRGHRAGARARDLRGSGLHAGAKRWPRRRIVPAKLVGQDKNTGSIKAGKVADLVLVEGDPSKRIGDLRQTRVVMLDGKLLDADALRTAAGFSGRPK